MLIRAQFTCLRRTSQKSQPAVCILSWSHKKCLQPVPLRHVCAQVTSNSGSAGPPNAAGMPDPWASSPTFSKSFLPAGDDSSSASMEPLTLPDSAAISAPPGPWDGADAVSTISSSPASSTTASPSTISEPGSASSYSYHDNDRAAGPAESFQPPPPPPTAAAPPVVTETTASGEIAGSSHSPSRSGSPGSSSPSRSSSPSQSDNPIMSGSSSMIPSTGSSSSSSSSKSAFNIKDARAGLSEDTAALLTRLRAELARTSNTPMPPRRLNKGRSNTSGSSSSVDSNSASSGPSELAANISNNSDSSSIAGGAGSSSRTSKVEMESVSTTRPEWTPGDATPPAAATAAAAALPPTGLSKEALAAALAASGAAVPVSEESTVAAADSPEINPTSSTTLGDFFGGLFKRQQPSVVSPASSPASSNPSSSSTTVGTTTATNHPASTQLPSSSSSTLPSSPTFQSLPVGSDSATAADGGTSRLASGATATAMSAGATATGSGSSRSIIGTGSSAAAGVNSSGAVGGSSSSSGRKRRAIVVGGGIGGLVSAARLAKEGFSVTLLEANSQVGGRCQSVQRGRFRFDTGPSLLLFPETYRRAFSALGTSLAQQVPVVRVTPAAYRVFFQGAGSLDMLYDVQRMVEQMEGVQKGAGGAYLDWLASARTALQLGMDAFISRDADGPGELLAAALQDEETRSLLASVGVAELLGNHHSRMCRRFREPRLRAMFTFQDLYVGLSPYTAPGVYSLLAATELTDGVWYPLGGFGQIRDALLRVGQGLGVRLRCGARVVALRTAPGEAGGQVMKGVTLASGEELEADLVVSNRDVPLTYELLRGPAETHGSTRARQLLTKDYSAGIIAFNWSIDKKLDQLLHHNVFLSGDFGGSWLRATSADTLARSPNFYVHCPGRTDPTACPPGSDSVMVLLPVANIQEMLRAQEADRRRGPLGALPEALGQRAVSLAASAAAAAGSSGSSSYSTATVASPGVSYSGLVAAGREAVLRSLTEAGISDVRQHIVDEMVIDPLEWRERYSLAHGAAFGLSHGLSQLSILRPGLSDKQVRGLYFVGASTRPGNGVPLTMISADLVTQQIMKDVATGVI